MENKKDWEELEEWQMDQELKNISNKKSYAEPFDKKNIKGAEIFSKILSSMYDLTKQPFVFLPPTVPYAKHASTHLMPRLLHKALINTSPNVTSSKSGLYLYKYSVSSMEIQNFGSIPSNISRRDFSLLVILYGLLILYT